MKNTPLYENGRFWVAKAKHGYEIYEAGIAHSTRRYIIGSEGQKWFERAKWETDRLARASETL